MQIIRDILTHSRFADPIVSLGNFDGVHLGHQAIIRQVVQDARTNNGTALVLTFYPHPLSVLRPAQSLPLILSLREKLLRLQQSGIDAVLLQHFTRPFSLLSAEDFIQRYLVTALGVKKVIVGHNVSFGYKRTGDARVLESYGQKYGFSVQVVGPVLVDGREVSSTEIRATLIRGDLREVSRLLGRPYAVSGRVVKGFQRGRGIGFPTANLLPKGDLLLPNGVYAVRCELNDQRVLGVANVGMNPTFGNNVRTIETHLFDFSADIYGKRLRVSFIERLRGEQKFSSLDALKRQIGVDAERARMLLEQEDDLV